MTWLGADRLGLARQGMGCKQPQASGDGCLGKGAEAQKAKPLTTGTRQGLLGEIKPGSPHLMDKDSTPHACGKSEASSFMSMSFSELTMSARLGDKDARVEDCEAYRIIEAIRRNSAAAARSISELTHP